MRIELGLSQQSLRQWQVELARRLQRLPAAAVGIRWSKPAGDAVPSEIAVLLELERWLRLSRPHLARRAEPSTLSSFVGAGGIDPDLVIDVTGGIPTAGRRRWRLSFDGAPGDAPLLAALSAGRVPMIGLRDAHSGALLASARPGLAAQTSLGAGLEAVLARTVDMVLAAVKGGAAPIRVRAASPRSSRRMAVGSATRSILTAARTLMTAPPGMPHSRIGWRFVGAHEAIDLGAPPASAWTLLPDDGSRAYSQPCPIVSCGQSWLFITERDMRSGKSAISAVQFGSTGPLGTPSRVLELDGDVSHPIVFEAEGNIWMVPERAGSRSVDLYRSSPFPGGWRHEARLVADVDARGAVPFRFDGRWWLSCTVGDGGSEADMLHLWQADALRGPWRPHRANPVLIDAAAARAAGRVMERNGRHIRPVRDMAAEGGGLALAEITRLDEEAFEQRIVADLARGRFPAVPGLSTLNRSGSLECIDSFDPGTAALWATPDLVRPGRIAGLLAPAARRAGRGGSAGAWD